MLIRVVRLIRPVRTLTSLNLHVLTPRIRFQAYSRIKLEKHNMSKINKPGCECVNNEEIENHFNMGPLERSLRTKVNRELHPEVFIVRNDSWKHSHHSGMKGAENTIESHFHVTIVSDVFEDAKLKSALARHRFVFKLLDEEVKKIHGFQVVSKTPAEWTKIQNDKPMRESSSKYFT